FRYPPFGLDPPLLFQTDERGINRALIQKQNIVTDLLDASGDPPPMQWAHRIEGLQDHEVQRALKDFGFLLFRHESDTPVDIQRKCTTLPLVVNRSSFAETPLQKNPLTLQTPQRDPWPSRGTFVPVIR